MIRIGMNLFDRAGNEVAVNNTNHEIISITKTLKVKTTYNDGRNIKYHNHIENFEYSMQDVGIHLFFEKADIHDHEQLNVKDDKYLWNKDTIINFFSKEQQKILGDLACFIPTGPCMDDALKEKIIADYYSKQKSHAQEEEFHSIHGEYYFGRIDLDTRFYHKTTQEYFDKHFYDKIYISKGIYEATVDGGHIVNWRSPIASLYYDIEATKMVRHHYVDVVNETYRGYSAGSPNNMYEHELMLKRNFNFNPLRFINTFIAGNDFFENGTADSFLLEVLYENRSNHKIADIIRSIQSNQNAIIRRSKNENIIVQGCAGSGKTMILLHRLSYLKYNKFLPRLSKVKIITPNRKFSVFIKDLAFSLELEEIARLPMSDYYLHIALNYQKQYKELDIIHKSNGHDNNTPAYYLKNNFMHETTWQEHDAAYIRRNILQEVKKEYQIQIEEIVKQISLSTIQSLAKKAQTVRDIGKKHIKVYIEDIYQGNKELFTNKDYFIRLLKLCGDLLMAKDEALQLLEQINSIHKQQNHQKNGITEFRRDIARYITQIDYAYSNLVVLNRSSAEIEKLNNRIRNFKDIHELIIQEIDTEEKRRQSISASMRRTNSAINSSELELEKILQQISILPFYKISMKRELTEKAAGTRERIEQLRGKKKKILSEHARKTEQAHAKAVRFLKEHSIELKPNDNLHYILDIVTKDIDASEVALSEFTSSVKSDSTDRDFVKSTLLIKPLTKLYKQVEEINKYISTNINRLKLNSHKELAEKIKLLKECEKGIKKILENENIDYKRLNAAIATIGEAYDDLTAMVCFFDEEISSIDKYIAELQKDIITVTELKASPQDRADLKKAQQILANHEWFAIRIFEETLQVFAEMETRKPPLTFLRQEKLVVLLCIYYLHAGPLQNPDEFLFIDEGQDYFLAEFELLKKINGSGCIMNIFGDLNQFISISGQKADWHEMKESLNATYYELNENYRNTVEITEFTNTAFKLKSLPIGVHGPVVESISKTMIEEIVFGAKQEDKEIRIAIIANDNEFITDLREWITMEDLFFGTARQAKGLEFDVVFAFPKSMTRNEKYIMFTRALNKLYIIDCEDRKN